MRRLWVLGHEQGYTGSWLPADDRQGPHGTRATSAGGIGLRSDLTVLPDWQDADIAGGGNGKRRSPLR